MRLGWLSVCALLTACGNETRRAGDVRYAGPEDICPPYDSVTSKQNRSEAREVIRRWRALPAKDQQAVIEFLKQL